MKNLSGISGTFENATVPIENHLQNNKVSLWEASYEHLIAFKLKAYMRFLQAVPLHIVSRPTDASKGAMT